jgi:hypothetical protein
MNTEYRFQTKAEARARKVNATSVAFAQTEGYVKRSDVDATYGFVDCGVSGELDNLLAGARIRFFGTGADNATFDFRIWAWTPCQGNPNLGYATLLASGSVTLSTLLGSSQTLCPIGAAERIADTLTLALSSGASTPKGPWAAIYLALGAVAGVHSPGDNTAALAILPELGSVQGIFFDFQLGTATGANAAVELFS